MMEFVLKYALTKLMFMRVYVCVGGGGVGARAKTHLYMCVMDRW